MELPAVYIVAKPCWKQPYSPFSSVNSGNNPVQNQINIPFSVNCVHKRIRQIIRLALIPNQTPTFGSWSDASRKTLMFYKDRYRLLCVFTSPPGFVSENNNCGSSVPSFTDWINQLQKCILVSGSTNALVLFYPGEVSVILQLLLLRRPKRQLAGIVSSVIFLANVPSCTNNVKFFFSQYVTYSFGFLSNSELIVLNLVTK
jgi:hypothetical protein